MDLCLTELNAIASRNSDAKDVYSARTAVEVVALRQVVRPLCRRPRDKLAFSFEDLRKINELGKNWSG